MLKHVIAKELQKNLQELAVNLVNSMLRHLQAVTRANGKRKKY